MVGEMLFGPYHFRNDYYAVFTPKGGKKGDKSKELVYLGEFSSNWEAQGVARQLCRQRFDAGHRDTAVELVMAVGAFEQQGANLPLDWKVRQVLYL